MSQVLGELPSYRGICLETKYCYGGVLQVGWKGEQGETEDLGKCLSVSMLEKDVVM